MPCRRSARNALVLAALLVVLCAGELAPGTVRADFGVSATVAVVASLLSSLFGFFGGRISTAVKRALEGLRGVVKDLGREIVNLASRMVGGFAALLGILKRFIARVFGPLWQALTKMWARLVRFLDRIFGPIINWLIKVRDYIQRIYDKFIRPIVDALDIARRVLNLLSLFGVDWARRLDQALYRLEQYFIAPFEFLVAKINEALDWINRIVTFDGLLQRVMLIQSLVRDIRLTTNLFWNAQTKVLTTAELRSRWPDKEPRTQAELRAEFFGIMITNGRESSAYVDELAKTIMLRVYGRTS